MMDTGKVEPTEEVELAERFDPSGTPRGWR